MPGHRYIEEYNLGFDAGEGGLPPHDNPHVWQSIAWYAWHAGWMAGEKARQIEVDHLKQLEEIFNARTNNAQ